MRCRLGVFNDSREERAFITAKHLCWRVNWIVSAYCLNVVFGHEYQRVYKWDTVYNLWLDVKDGRLYHVNLLLPENQCLATILQHYVSYLLADVCVYNGRMYTQGQKWQDGCKYDCICTDGLTGKYECTERFVTYKSNAVFWHVYINPTRYFDMFT